MHRIILLGFFSFIFLLFSQDGTAQTYKYVDKDGVVHFTDTPTKSKFIPEEEIEPTPAEKMATLNFLSEKFIAEASSSHTVGRTACYMCASEVIQAVKARGLSPRKEFLEIMENLDKDKKGTVEGLLKEITRAAIIQGVSLPNGGSCLTATYHSK